MRYMVLNKITLCSLCFISMLLFSAKVAATCTVSTPYSTITGFNPATFSAGVDMPVGTVLYRQITYGFNGGLTLNCTNGSPVLKYSMSGGTLIPGSSDTYSSGISGVGLKFYVSVYGTELAMPTTRTVGNGYTDYNSYTFSIKGVKTGVITPGTVDGSILPAVHIDVTDNDGVPVQAAYTQLSGGSYFTVNTPTCTTPDFNYTLNTVTPADFSNSNRASTWTDTPVTLTGCGTFSGNASNNTYYDEIQQQNAGVNRTIYNRGTRQRNILSITLSPQTSVIDASSGVLSIASGSGAATGLGIQMGQKLSGAYLPFSFGTKVDVPAALGSNANITFPLGARLIRTSGVLTPGSIQASVTYTITYN